MNAMEIATRVQLVEKLLEDLDHYEGCRCEAIAAGDFIKEAEFDTRIDEVHATINALGGLV